MVINKINFLLSKAIENSNLEKKDFKPLDGKLILIDLQNTSTQIHLMVENGSIYITEEVTSEPNLVLEGSPIGFFNYINNLGDDHNIKITGKASLAENFSNLTEKINIDWEGMISEYTNDDVAFYSSKIFEFVSNRKNEIKKSVERNLKEYIKDETDIIPSKQSVNNYVQDVDNVRKKLDLLEAKFQRIKSK